MGILKYVLMLMKVPQIIENKKNNKIIVSIIDSIICGASPQP